MIYRLKPVVKDYVWGGNTLKHAYNKECDGDVLAETWELSCHPDGLSLIVDSNMAGQTLKDFLCLYPNAIGTYGKDCTDFPLLIKLIDAKHALSVQVHPNDDYALRYENGYGKTEMWYVLQAEPQAFLYYGFERTLTKEEFSERVQNGTVLDVLHKVPVKAGDSFFIEAGTVHAIGAGIVIAEVQQSSNLTYRIYDYGRLGADGKPRELHIEKATQTAHLCPAKTDYDFGTHIADCPYFTVDIACIDDTVALYADDTSFLSLLVLDGEGMLTQNGSQSAYKKGDSFFVTAGSKSLTAQGSGKLLVSRLGMPKNSEH